MTGNLKSEETGQKPTSKVCCWCLISLPIDRFTSHLSTKDGYQPYCRECKRWYDLFRLHGITKKAFNELFDKQQGRCANSNCHQLLDLTFWNECNVDHDPVTERVRGLLCRRCNTDLGVVEADDGKHLKGLQLYLDFYPTKTFETQIIPADGGLRRKRQRQQNKYNRSVGKRCSDISNDSSSQSS